MRITPSRLLYEAGVISVPACSERTAPMQTLVVVLPYEPVTPITRGATAPSFSGPSVRIGR